MNEIMDAKLQVEFKYYLKNQDNFVQKYNGKFLVIKGEELVGVYDTMEDAYFKSKEKYALGSFLIQECTPGNEAYTEVFHSRVSF